MNPSRLADFLFECAILKKLKRTGYPFLGRGEESVGEHTFGTILVGLVLSYMAKDVDTNKVIKMLLIHDLPEARTGDPNAVHKRYVTVDEKRAREDLLNELPFKEEFKALFNEFHDNKTKEAMLAQDADKLDFLISLKEQYDIGCNDAKIWIDYAINRLKTNEAKILANAILSTSWSNWWMKDIVTKGKENNS